MRERREKAAAESHERIFNVRVAFFLQKDEVPSAVVDRLIHHPLSSRRRRRGHTGIAPVVCRPLSSLQRGSRLLPGLFLREPLINRVLLVPCRFSRTGNS